MNSLLHFLSVTLSLPTVVMQLLARTVENYWNTLFLNSTTSDTWISCSTTTFTTRRFCWNCVSDTILSQQKLIWIPAHVCNASIVYIHKNKVASESIETQRAFQRYWMKDLNTFCMLSVLSDSVNERFHIPNMFSKK